MWQAGYLIIVFATLDSSCLKTISKAGFTSKKSNVGRYFGRLDIGSSTKQILNKNNESNATKPQDGLKPFEGYQSDQPTSTVNGKWHPFIPASRLCGITTASETDGMVITAPYQSNCWQIKGDEMFLSILYGNNEFILSCPDSDDSYPYGHVEIISDQSPVPDLPTPSDLSTTIGLVSESDQPQAVPISPTTTAPTPISTSNPVDIRYFPYMYYPFDPMLHHKPKPYGYPWAFPPKVPTTAPTPTTSQSTATTSSTVASNPEQPRYPLPPMYYPYGPMLYHHKPRPYGYPWAFPPKVPTTAPTATTSQSTATTSSTVASNPEQPRYPLPPMYYPYGPMLYHHKPRPYGYPWAFPTKLPTTAPTETTSQSTATSSTVASNPEQPRYPLPPMYYPYGPMLYHHKPRPYGYPWAFPTKVPTTPTKLALPNITTMSPTAATKLDSIANDPYQPRYPLHHMYSPFGPMHCHFGHSHHLGYPLAFPAKVFTTAPNKLTSTTETPTVTSMTTPPIIASNSQQPPYLFNPYNFGQILHHPRPMPFDYLWAFPPKAPVTAQKISAPTTKTATTSPINCHGH
ncbi:hypothetical protein Baya_2519 [Bagarius yarrelli]|uniref:Uncharacterized protein n=1 Tax=Bagarius yarrelli TaxID=175774 RepID=A0A556VXX3_BAGYA|nr:hypothetical protein Baya_2519 [Bagarius yarrelli]